MLFQKIIGNAEHTDRSNQRSSPDFGTDLQQYIKRTYFPLSSSKWNILSISCHFSAELAPCFAYWKTDI